MRPNWDTYFMGFAKAASERATCDRKHVGAVIVVGAKFRCVNCENGYAVAHRCPPLGGHVAATGYNGSVAGAEHCDDAGHDMQDGHCVRTIHAEMNALAQAAKVGVGVDGAAIYTTASPCWDCFRVLVNAGIVRFVYLEDYRGEEHKPRIEAVVASSRGRLSVEKLPPPPVACVACGEYDDVQTFDPHVSGVMPIKLCGDCRKEHNAP